MAIDLTRLQAAAQAARASRPTLRGVAALVTDLRRASDLRALLPVETLLLPPVPWIEAGEWRLSALLAQAAVAGPGSLRVSPPWGVVNWALGGSGEEWASAKPALQRLAELPATATLVDPTGAPVLITRAERGPARLYAALDSLLALPAAPPPSFGALAALYGGLLPAPFYDLAHAVAPSSAAWLAPAAP